MADTLEYQYTQIAEDLAQLSEVQPNGHAVHMYVVGRKGSAMLVDTGLPDVGPQVIASLEKAGWACGDFKYILITHEHWDHYGATADLRAWAKDASVVSHIYCGWTLSQRWTRFINPGWHANESGWQYGPPSKENFAAFEASEAAPMKIDQIIWNENTLEVGKAIWRIWHVAGHCQGHVLLYRESDKATIVGDLIQGTSFSPQWLALLTDIRSQRQSLERLRDLTPSLVAMGHHAILRGEMIDREITRALKRVHDIMDVARRGLKDGVADPAALALLACKEILHWEPAEVPQHTIPTMRAALAQLCQEDVARLERVDRWSWTGG